MNNVTLRGLMNVHKANRRSANEQARELAHLRSRTYRGIPVSGPAKGEEIHGKFTYRGRVYFK